MAATPSRLHPKGLLLFQNSFIHRNIMKREEFNKKLKRLSIEHKKLLKTPNAKVKKSNGVFHRYVNPVVTAEHIPLSWRYDLNYATNPYLMERLGVNGTFNA